MLSMSLYHLWGGLGEAARAINVAADVVDTLDDVHDANKAADGFESFTDVIIDTYEVKCPQQIKMSEATSAWDDFLGPNQTNFIKFIGEYDMNRIFLQMGIEASDLLIMR